MSRLIIGLTGGIGSGKSTAAAEFERLGAYVIDVDAIGRDVAEVGGPAHEPVLERFGSHLAVDGRLDRAGLAKIVFSDPAELAALEAISHPAINGLIAEGVADTAPDAIIVLDMAILLGSVLGRWGDAESDGYNKVVVVEAPLDTRLERLAGRGMDADDAQARIESQPSDEERRTVADHVIDNGGDTAALAAEVSRVWAALTAGH
ncbi:MAG: dephospho-CoA kinase [Actinomycetia bacterium]|nr:dephospho-CoA kinase [Actinomycetes bacterium]